MKPILCVLMLYTLVIGNDIPTYRFDYIFYQKIDGWVKLHHAPVNWNEARLRCHAEGAVLASPLNVALLDVMQNIMEVNMSTSCGVYTGIHATFAKGIYSSVEGIPLSKIPVRWALDEPDNYQDNENCTVLLPDGTVADVQCSNLLPYICYKKKTMDVVLTACGTIDSKYQLEPSTGSCYKYHHKCETWSRAYMTCAAEGGHLAIINSADEVTALKNLHAKQNKNHCGYNDQFIIGFLMWNKDWFTIHGENLEETGYSSWDQGQPNNLKYKNLSQECGSMCDNGLLNDVWCDVVTFAFICEKSPDSLLFNT